MDGIRDLLDAARSAGLLRGHFRGLLHIAIGRTVARADGAVIATGLTWRALAAVLKELRFDRELVREFGADPDGLSPRDREKFWYAAIAKAGVDGREAFAEAERLTGPLAGLGFVVRPATNAPPRAAPPPPPADSQRPPAKARPKPPPPPEEPPPPPKRKRK